MDHLDAFAQMQGYNDYNHMMQVQLTQQNQAQSQQAQNNALAATTQMAQAPQMQDPQQKQGGMMSNIMKMMAA